MMIKAVLLDLDDTLLTNDDAVFLPAYAHKADTFFYEQIGVSNIGRLAMQSVLAMLQSTAYHVNNTDIAIEFIAEKSGVSPEVLSPLFEIFYNTVFPTLEPLTQSKPEAAKLIQILQSQGIAVVIATNPVYPDIAIQHRLRWANIPHEFDTYALVTTGDRLHFIKPRAEYYAEILARIGVEPEEALMVGNSLENDIYPAAKLGLHTYQIVPESDAVSYESGTLSQFLSQVQQPHWGQAYTAKPLQVDMIEPELRGNLGALFGLLKQVKPHQWNQHPDPDEWSILELVCHLQGRERDVQRPRLMQIVHEDNPFIGVPNTDVPRYEAYVGREIESGHDFVMEREKTLDFLCGLSATDWERPAQHSIFSTTNLLEMAHFVAKHDRLHITQICQTLGRCS